MSHDPFSIPPPPMTAERARDIARAYQGFANYLREIDGPAIGIGLGNGNRIGGEPIP